MISTSLKLILILFFVASIAVSAQTFGFGCLGFTGGYAGYSHQKYRPDGLNQYINVFNLSRTDSLSERLSGFGSSNGFRIGLYLFRKKFSSLFITGKGFYQYLNEKHQAVEQLALGNITTSYEVKIINWGLGFDLGVPLISFVNWKIIDAALTYNQAKYSDTQNFPGAVTIVKNYKSDFEFGYSIGTGIIIEIFGEYVTLEGLAGYSKIKIDNVKMDDGTKLTVSEFSSDEMRNFISDGGFNAVVQLNIGLPL